MSVAAVLTNAGLITFTMSTFNSHSTSTRFWIFVAFQWACFALQYIIMEAIPDVPEEIEIQLQREEFIVRKLIDKVGDELNDDVRGVDAPLEIHKLAFGHGTQSQTSPIHGAAKP